MKTVFKKAISVLLVAVMVFGAAPLAGFVGLELPELNLLSTRAEAVTYSGTCGENIIWTFNETTGTLEITGSGAISDYSNVSELPWYTYNSKIKYVVLSEGLTRIGDAAFDQFKMKAAREVGVRSPLKENV